MNNYPTKIANSLSLEIEYFFGQQLGLVTGIGINTCHSKAWLDYFDNYGTNNISKTDIDNESYYLYNQVNDLNEEYSVSTISVPVKLKWRFRPGKKWDFFAEAGLNLMYTIAAKMKAKGQSIWQGYYPQYRSL